MKLRAPNRQILEAGVHPATLAGIEPREAMDGRPYLLWQFAASAHGQSVEVTAPSSTSFGPRSKARGWAEALLGRRITDGEEIDVDELVGLGCALVLGTVERDGSIYNAVEAVTRPASPPGNDRPLPF